MHAQLILTAVYNLFNPDIHLVLAGFVPMHVHHTCQPREVQSLDKLTEIPGFESKSLDTPPPPNLNVSIKYMQKFTPVPDNKILALCIL